MILPAKHLGTERSLVGTGAEILQAIEAPKTISETWTRIQEDRKLNGIPITFDWFVLAVSWLYPISAVELENGLLKRRYV